MVMEALRVYLVWDHPLLRDTVQAVLAQAGLRLVGETQMCSALADLHTLQPDVLLIEEGESLPEQVFAYLSHSDCARIVCISLVDNRLHIYHREERILSQMDDLVAALQF